MEQAACAPFGARRRTAPPGQRPKTTHERRALAGSIAHIVPRGGERAPHQIPPGTHRGVVEPGSSRHAPGSHPPTARPRGRPRIISCRAPVGSWACVTKGFTVTSLLLSRWDLDFLLYEWLDVEALTPRVRTTPPTPATRSTPCSISPRRWRPSSSPPHNKTSDTHEPTFDGERVHVRSPRSGAALRSLRRNRAGGQPPWTNQWVKCSCRTLVAGACFAWFQAANIATASYPFPHRRQCQPVAGPRFPPRRSRRYVRPMVKGRYFGTMCLSEPQAGSSLADVSTRALSARRRAVTGSSGTRCGSPGGDHELSENIVHLVLAKDFPVRPDRREGPLAVHRAEVPRPRRRSARVKWSLICWRRGLLASRYSCE